MGIKVTEFNSDATPTGDDLLMGVNAPGSSPASRKWTLDATLDYLLTRTQTWTGANTFESASESVVRIERTGNLANATFIGSLQFFAEDFGSSPDVYANITGIMELDDATEEGSLQISLMEGGVPNTKYIHFNDAGLNKIDILRPLDISATQWIEFGSDPADQGVLRLSADDIIAWEDPAGGQTEEATLTYTNEGAVDVLKTNQRLRISTSTITGIEFQTEHSIAVADGVNIGGVAFRGVLGDASISNYGAINARMENDGIGVEEGSMILRVMETGAVNTNYLTLNLLSSGVIGMERNVDMKTNAILFGTTPATTGDIRLEENSIISWRNNANDGNVSIKINNNDSIDFDHDIRITRTDLTPDQSLYLNQTTPTDNTVTGQYKFRSDSDTTVLVQYAEVRGLTGDVTNATSSGRIQLRVREDNALATYLEANGETETIILSKATTIPSLTKLLLDGGSDTSIRESAANVITFETAGTDHFNFASGTSASLDIAASLFPILQFGATLGAPESKIFRNVAGNELIIATNSDVAEINTLRLQDSGDVWMQAAKKLFFDGGSNTYIWESTADILEFSTGGNNRFLIENGLAQVHVFGSAFVVDSTQKIFLDSASTGDTSIRESAANVMTFEVGGTDRLDISTSLISLNLNQTTTRTGKIDIQFYDNSAELDDQEILALLARADTDTASSQVYTNIVSSTRDVTNATASGMMELRVRDDNIIRNYITLDGETHQVLLEPDDVRGLEVVSGATDGTEANVVVGAVNVLANNATDGFLYIPVTDTGAPTGTPTAFTGKVAMCFDPANKNLYIYNTDASAWESVTLA